VYDRFELYAVLSCIVFTIFDGSGQILCVASDKNKGRKAGLEINPFESWLNKKFLFYEHRNHKNIE
jgi:hypothetical protein